MIENASSSATFGAYSQNGSMGLGNRRSIRLSYGGNGSFPRFLRLTGQRRTRDMRGKGRFMSAQEMAQSVHDRVTVGRHYTEPALNPSPHYRGPATRLTEAQALAHFRELFRYFGITEGYELPELPSGLPGTTAYRGEGEALSFAQEGFRYFMAVVHQQPRAQWNAIGRIDERLLELRRQERDRDPPAWHYGGNVAAISMASGPAQMVYFIATASGPIKIGIAASPEKRMAGLQTAHHEKLTLLAVCDGGADQERAYHHQFAAHRLHGEWFTRVPEIEAEIARLNDLPPADAGYAAGGAGA